MMVITDRLNGLMSSEDYGYYLEAKGEIEAERAVERYYEDRGWQEALMESYVESGFIARF